MNAVSRYAALTVIQYQKEKMLLKSLATLALCAVFAPAQTTWGGLKFGMSQAEVRKQYNKPLNEADSERGPALNDTIVNWNWYPEATSARLKATFSPSAKVTFIFDNVSNRLRQIELVVQKPYDGDSYTRTWLFIDQMTDGLTAKYGLPVIVRGDGCEHSGEDHVFKTPKPNLTCKRMWRGDGQSITMTWFTDKGSLSLLVLEYAAFAPEL